MRFTDRYNLGKSQWEVDFVDIELDADLALFVDPFAISRRTEPWARRAHETLVSYFQGLVDAIRTGNDEAALERLGHLREPNETRLGLSAREPRGAGVGHLQARQLLDALKASEAVRTGLIASLEDCELMVEGIGQDKVSDLTTNIIRGELIEYTQQQCALHGIPTRNVPAKPAWSIEAAEWRSDYRDLPIDAHGAGIILVPKIIARSHPNYDHTKYYRHHVLEYLQVEHLNAGTSLVRALRNGTRRVFKKDLEKEYPCSKDFLFRFSKEHPEVLEGYKAQLERLERSSDHLHDGEAREHELAIAAMLRRVLPTIAPGHDQAATFHKFIVGALELLFFPGLLNPRMEQEIHEGRKRIDIVMENGAHEGTFWRLHALRDLAASYIAIECKNYAQQIGNPELDQLAGRFSPVRGQVGILVCRRHVDRARIVAACRDTLRDQRGLIIPLDDADTDTLLRFVEESNRRAIEPHLSGIIDEIYLGS